VNLDIDICVFVCGWVSLCVCTYIHTYIDMCVCERESVCIYIKLRLDYLIFELISVITQTINTNHN
jgi:hypothetical protein